MNALDLGILYLIIGTGWALAILIRRGSAVDAFLLFLAWPLYGPFLLSEAPSKEPQQGSTLDLEELLPDQVMAQRTELRLEAARRRVKEIEAVLSQPDFDPEEAEARRARHEQAGRQSAVEAAERTLRNIEHLKRLKNHFRSQIEEIEELTRQLRTQAEVFRLAGGEDNSALMNELIERVDGLDAVLEDALIFEVLAP